MTWPHRKYQVLLPLKGLEEARLWGLLLSAYRQLSLLSEDGWILVSFNIMVLNCTLGCENAPKRTWPISNYFE